MHQPSAFREERLEILHQLIRAHPLATLITTGPGGLIANLVPFTLADTGDTGTLRAHIAKANDHQVDALQARAETLSVLNFRVPDNPRGALDKHYTV
ncbi:MAG TPA: FMN-binding negative transcriptional regulator [Bryobacteraceae bacterium]|jgi:transcriptional regulator